MSCVMGFIHCFSDNTFFKFVVDSFYNSVEFIDVYYETQASSPGVVSCCCCCSGEKTDKDFFFLSQVNGKLVSSSSVSSVLFLLVVTVSPEPEV